MIQNQWPLAQEWEKLLFSTGGALKCFWFLMSCRWREGKAHLHTTTTSHGDLQPTLAQDPTLITIKRIELTEAFCTLGVFLTPSGDTAGAMKFLMGIALDYATIITDSNLSRQAALTSYVHYLLPKLCYQPPLLSLTRNQCNKLMTPILQALLPKLHINRNMVRSIIYGPVILGGLSIPNLYTVQGLDKVQLFLGHIRLGDCTGKLLHINLTYVHLLSSSSHFFLNKHHDQYSWVETSWMTSLWAAKLTFAYTNQWLPVALRENDKFLMDYFNTRQFSAKVMDTLNCCRIRQSTSPRNKV